MQGIFRSLSGKARQILSWGWAHKIRVAVVAIVLTMIAPHTVKSAIIDPCCAILAAGLSTISSALNSVVGGGLNRILSVEQTVRDFEQTVVWPQSMITQARALVGSIQGTYRQIENITHLPVNSASLPGTRQLEQNLLSRDSSQISQTSANYTAVYGLVPDAASAPAQVRNMIDMTDAVAQEAMKRAIEIDHLATLELQAADQINQSIQNAAPGSAPIIEAQADAWLVRANAYTQAATADLMRLRAIALANGGATIKFGAANTASIGQQVQDLLKRQ